MKQRWRDSASFPWGAHQDRVRLRWELRRQDQSTQEAKRGPDFSIRGSQRKLKILYVMQLCNSSDSYTMFLDFFQWYE